MSISASRCLLSLALAGTAVGVSRGGDEWGQFRGPTCGVSADKGLPEKWSKTENVRWSVEIPGRGWSSPVIWKDQVFVTSAISEGGFKEPSKGIYGSEEINQLIKEGVPAEEASKRILDRDIETTSQPTQIVRRMVYALDAKTGKTLWEAEAAKGVPAGGRHRKNTFASGTPLTDGQRVYAYFGNVGVYCYSMDGKPLWSCPLDPVKIYLDFGDGASLAESGDLLYVLNDNEDSCYILALDKASGKTVWKKERAQSSGWSTPVVWKNAQRTEVVAAGAKSIVSYDAKSGEELWTMTVGAMNVCSTPVATPELLYFSAAQSEGGLRPLLAIKPGGKGDITVPPEREMGEFMVWRAGKAGASIPSPLVYDKRVYVLNDRGFLGAYKADDGKQLYRERIGENSSPPFTSSPWAYGGKVYCLSEDGDTYVFSAGDKYELLGKNSLDEMCMATPAIAGNSLFVRTLTRLYRIGS